jgi:hypothetical protein
MGRLIPQQLIKLMQNIKAITITLIPVNRLVHGTAAAGTRSYTPVLSWRLLHCR